MRIKIKRKGIKNQEGGGKGIKEVREKPTSNRNCFCKIGVTQRKREKFRTKVRIEGNLRERLHNSMVAV